LQDNDLDAARGQRLHRSPNVESIAAQPIELRGYQRFAIPDLGKHPGELGTLAGQHFSGPPFVCIPALHLISARSMVGMFWHEKPADLAARRFMGSGAGIVAGRQLQRMRSALLKTFFLSETA
jgi:hypothetical protein